jgi:hypothetical protein
MDYYRTSCLESLHRGSNRYHLLYILAGSFPWCDSTATFHMGPSFQPELAIRVETVTIYNNKHYCALIFFLLKKAEITDVIELERFQKCPTGEQNLTQAHTL